MLGLSHLTFDNDIIVIAFGLSWACIKDMYIHTRMVADSVIARLGPARLRVMFVLMMSRIIVHWETVYLCFTHSIRILCIWSPKTALQIVDLSTVVFVFILFFFFVFFHCSIHFILWLLLLSTKRLVYGVMCSMLITLILTVRWSNSNIFI